MKRESDLMKYKYVISVGNKNKALRHFESNTIPTAGIMLNMGRIKSNRRSETWALVIDKGNKHVAATFLRSSLDGQWYRTIRASWRAMRNIINE